MVVGCYESNDDKGDKGFELTECAKDLDSKTQGKLTRLMNMYVSLIIMYYCS